MIGTIETVARKLVDDARRAEQDAEDARVGAVLAELSKFDPDPPEARKQRATIETYRPKIAKLEAEKARLAAERDELSIAFNIATDQRTREHHRLRREAICGWRLQAATDLLRERYERDRYAPGEKPPSKAVKILLDALNQLSGIRDLIVDPPAELSAYQELADRAIAEYEAAIVTERERIDARARQHEEERRKQSIYNPRI